ncbi:MAG: cyclic nucleotide-binding/CBS domain-containing protein [Candidatus Hodarchaeota archaeon]
MPYVIDVMREPIFCGPEILVTEAAKTMKKNRIGSIIVVDGAEQVIGVITERDLVHRVLGEDRDPKTTPIEAVMSKNITTVGPYVSLIEALKIMRKNDVRRLPVTRNKKLIGILTEREIATALIRASDEQLKLSRLKDLGEYLIP